MVTISLEELLNETEARNGDTRFLRGNHECFQDVIGHSDLGLWDVRGAGGSETVYPSNCLTMGFTTAVLKSME